MRSRAHQFDGKVFADVAGDDDERDVEASGLEHLQGVKPTEARQAAFGNHEIPRAVRERIAHGGRRAHTHDSRVEISAVQLAGHELLEHVGLIDDECTETRGQLASSTGSHTDTITPDPGRPSTAIAPP